MTTTLEKRSALPLDLLQKMDAYWRAANYLSVGQIYLLDNPLLKTPSYSSTSSRVSWATGERRPASISSMST
jgi:phosphoketolase